MQSLISDIRKHIGGRIIERVAKDIALKLAASRKEYRKASNYHIIHVAIKSLKNMPI